MGAPVHRFAFLLYPGFLAACGSSDQAPAPMDAASEATGPPDCHVFPCGPLGGSDTIDSCCVGDTCSNRYGGKDYASFGDAIHACDVANAPLEAGPPIDASMSPMDARAPDATSPRVDAGLCPVRLVAGMACMTCLHNDCFIEQQECVDDTISCNACLDDPSGISCATDVLFSRVVGCAQSYCCAQCHDPDAGMPTNSP